MFNVPFYLERMTEPVVSNSQFVPEDYNGYRLLLEKSGNEILKDAFTAIEDLSPDQGKYLGMREIMMALIVMAAEKDRRKT